MDSQTIENFLAETRNLQSRLSFNAKNRIYTERALNLVLAAYYKVENTGQWVARPGRDTAKADKLIGMGFEKAIYGIGRDLLK